MSVIGESKCRRIVRQRSRGILDIVTCERCGLALDCSLHHRLKRSHLPRYRFWEPSNCVMLCGDGTRGCHGWVEFNPKDAAVEGFHVWSHEEPAQVPVKLWHTDVYVLLDDLGGYTRVDKSAPTMDNG